MVSGDWSSKFWDDWIVQGWWKFLIFQNKFFKASCHKCSATCFFKKNLWLTSSTRLPPFFHTPRLLRFYLQGVPQISRKVPPPPLPLPFKPLRPWCLRWTWSLEWAVKIQALVLWAKAEEGNDPMEVWKSQGLRGLAKNTQNFLGGCGCGDGLYWQITTIYFIGGWIFLTKTLWKHLNFER